MSVNSERPALDFNAIRRVPIAVILAKLGLELKRSGSRLVGTCPIHRGTNPCQFVVTPANNTWFCFGDCNRGGGSIELVAEIQSIDLVRGAECISEWLAIPGARRMSSKPSNGEVAMSESNRLPTHKVFVVSDPPEGSDRKAFWSSVGRGWSFQPNIAVSNRLVILDYTEEDRAKEKAAREAREEQHEEPAKKTYAKR
jgi:CHC2 zinc finger